MKHRVARAIRIALTAIITITIFGFMAMLLWNWLMPSIFGLRQISFWQALGLVILSKIFFSSFHIHNGRRRNWRRLRERWEQMTPEEREKLRDRFGDFCGPAKAEPKA